LLEHFIGIYAEKYNLPAKRLSAAALEGLIGHAWPGNVRALRHAVERAIILSEGTMLEVDDFSLASGSQEAGARVPSAATVDTTNLGDLEKETVARALKDHKRNISRAAAALGVTRASLYRRMQKYGL